METKKIFVAADIHGSMIGLDTALELAQDYMCDKILLLGDIFGANSKEMTEKLNNVASKLTIIKGNNDWYFEPPDFAKFQVFENTYENLNGRIAYLCHGHKLNDMSLDSYGAKVILQGHIHRPFIEQSQGVIRVCPGSISSPRFGSEKSFCIIDDKKITIYSVYGEILDEIDY